MRALLSRSLDPEGESLRLLGVEIDWKRHIALKLECPIDNRLARDRERRGEFPLLVGTVELAMERCQAKWFDAGSDQPKAHVFYNDWSGTSVVQHDRELHHDLLVST
jgi:hypothetical protein